MNDTQQVCEFCKAPASPPQCEAEAEWPLCEECRKALKAALMDSLLADLN